MRSQVSFLTIFGVLMGRPGGPVWLPILVLANSECFSEQVWGAFGSTFSTENLAFSLEGLRKSDVRSSCNMALFWVDLGPYLS